jgi:hypothetical protein
MAYEWSDLNYGLNSFGFSIMGGTSNGEIGIDITAVHLDDNSHTPADWAVFMGRVKDALEGAGLAVGAINFLGNAAQTLTQA